MGFENVSWTWNPKRWFFGKAFTRDGMLFSKWFGIGPVCILVESFGY